MDTYRYLMGEFLHEMFVNAARVSHDALSWHLRRGPKSLVAALRPRVLVRRDERHAARHRDYGSYRM